jgi:hypothetical protein
VEKAGNGSILRASWVSAGGEVALDGFRVNADSAGHPWRGWIIVLTIIATGIAALAVSDARAIARRLDTEVDADDRR